MIPCIPSVIIVPKGRESKLFKIFHSSIRALLTFSKPNLYTTMEGETRILKVPPLSNGGKSNVMVYITSVITDPARWSLKCVTDILRCRMFLFLNNLIFIMIENVGNTVVALTMSIIMSWWRMSGIL